MAKKQNNKKKNSRSNYVKKQTKTVKNNKAVTDTNTTPSIKNAVRTVVIILIIFGLFYFITWFITRDKTKTDNNNSYQSGFSYSEIMAGRSFSMSDGDYYVLFYDSTDEDIEEKYSPMVSRYRGKGDLKIYTVNMGDGLNKSYAKEESNNHPNNASELAINGPTLIKISNHGVVDYIEGEESIKSVLE